MQQHVDMWFHFVAVTLLLRVTAGCVVDPEESLSYYNGMQFMLLTPMVGATVWNHRVSALIGTYIPGAEVFSLANRQGWRLQFEVQDVIGKSQFSCDIDGFKITELQSLDIRWVADMNAVREWAPGSLELRVTVTHPTETGSASVLLNTKFNYQPLAPLPLTVQPLGDGAGLTLVSPALPPPQTRTQADSVYRLGRACYYMNNLTPCDVSTFAAYLHTALRERAGRC